MEGELQLNLRQIIQVLEDILGRPSRWNGKAYLARTISFGGAAHYDGSISVSELVYGEPNLRWRTMIHEAIHTFSPPYTRPEYNAAQGWEEGVVEQMQRLLRPQVLAALGVMVQAEVLANAEADHQYNAYIVLLEDLRLHLRDAPVGFYRTLLSTPLPERATVLRQSGIMLEEQERQAYRRALLKAVFLAAE
jgi:hypothetical protein